MTKIFETPLYPYARHADQDAATPPRHSVTEVGAGPVGLTAALDLAQKGVQVLLLDDNDRVSTGSRAICFAKRPLKIMDRLGCGQALVDKGIVWNRGRVFFGDREICDFDLLPETGHRRPPSSIFSNITSKRPCWIAFAMCRRLAPRSSCAVQTASRSRGSRQTGCASLSTRTKEAERRPENVLSRLRMMLGPNVEFTPE